jgi:hypothetical protein
MSMRFAAVHESGFGPKRGTQGAEEHVNHPDSIAWKSMCATDEGKQKGEKWCKRAAGS